MIFARCGWIFLSLFHNNITIISYNTLPFNRFIKNEWTAELFKLSPYRARPDRAFALQYW